LFERQRRARDHDIGVVIPGDVVQEVIFHRRPHGELESIPVRQHISADPRAVHNADTFDRDNPAPQEIAVAADPRANAVERVAVKQVSVSRAVLHEFPFVAEFANDGRLAVDLEILVAPAVKGLEKLGEIFLCLAR
jgi:hypothetical protein